MDKSNRRAKFAIGTVLGFAVVLQLCFAEPALAASVTLSWTYNYTVDVACTSSVTKNCVSGFEYGTTPDGGTTLSKVGTVANSTPSTSGATAVSTSFTQGPPYGSWFLCADNRARWQWKYHLPDSGPRVRRSDCAECPDRLDRDGPLRSFLRASLPKA